VKPRPLLALLLALLLVWAAMVMPHEIADLSPTTFLRLPLELVLLVAVALILPVRAARAVAAVVGVVLGLLLLMAFLDLGFGEVLDRPFDPVNDWAYVGPAYGVLGDSVGGVLAVGPKHGKQILTWLSRGPGVQRVWTLPCPPGWQPPGP